MLDTAFGLPVHPLVVHATAVLVPLAAIVVCLAAVNKRFRDWAGWLPMALAAVAAVLVPITTGSGEALEESVTETALTEAHTEMGEQLLPFVLVLLVAAVAMWWLGRRSAGAEGKGKGKGLSTLVAVVAVAAALGSLVQVGRIGHSGAKASWSDTAGASTQNGGESGDSDDD